MKKLVVFLVPIIGAMALGSLLWSWVLAAPVLTNNGLSVDEGSSNNVISGSELSVFDADDPAAVYTYTVNGAPVNGTLALSGATLGVNDEFTQSDIDANQLTYAHNGSETSADSFTFTVENVTETIASNQTFSINVDPVNDPPVANNDAIVVAEGGTATTLVGGASSVLANDTDPENDTLTAALLTGPTRGTLTLNANGTFEYGHDNSENFLDSFEYEACDPDGECDSATVTIEITPVVDITPEISPDTFDVNEASGGGTLIGVVTWEDVEVDNGYDSVSFAIVGGNDSNIFMVTDDGEIMVRAGQNIPLYEEQSQFLLTVRIIDSGDLSDNAAITVNVIKTNEPPVAANDAIVVDKGDTATSLVGEADSVRANDSDPDGSVASLTVSLVTGPARGSLTLNATGTFEYTHNNSENFSDSFTYRICDAGAPQKCDTAVVNITINQVVNKAPVISNNPADFDIEIDENALDNGDVLVTITVNDVEVDGGYDTLTFSISDGNAGNVFSITKTGAKTAQLRVADSSQLDHETNPSFELEVTVTDSADLSDMASITITVNDVNETPQIDAGQSFNINENSAVNATVGTVTFTDPDVGDTHTFEIYSGNTPGTPFKINNSGVIQVNNGILDYESKSSYTLGIRITDSGGLQDERSVTVLINDVNEKPTIAAGQSFSIVGFAPNGTVVGTVNASDPDAGDTLTYAIAGGNTLSAFAINAGNGRITVNNSDALDFDVRPTFNLSVRVTDDGDLTDTKTVVINLTKPPTFFVMLPMLASNYQPDEPNNTCAQAYTIYPNVTYGSFLPEDKNDFYRFTLSGARNVVVELTNFAPIEGQIILYRGVCGALTLLGNNGNFSSTKVINAGLQPAGTYYIWVIRDGPASTTPYNLRVNATP